MNVSTEAWARLLQAGGIRRYQPATVLLRQGEPPTHVIALVAGRVKVSRTSPDGNILLLAIRGPGEILGDMAVLGGDGRSATVIAVDHCETRIILAARFLSLVRSLGLENELLRQAMTRMRESDEWRAELAALPAGRRVVRTLLRLAVPRAAMPIDVALDQTEIGQAAGLSRSTVAAELSRLREQGVIATVRRRILITDLPRLQALAGPDPPTSDFRQ